MYEVRVYRAGEEVGRPLPTEEYQEELPGAAIVLEARSPWFKVQLDDGAAWLKAEDPDNYWPLERLLSVARTYLTAAWNGKLAAWAGGAARVTVPKPPPPWSQLHVRVIEFRRVGGALWLHAEVLRPPGWGALPEEPTVMTRGWVPAHNEERAVTVWFFTRD